MTLNLKKACAAITVFGLALLPALGGTAEAKSSKGYKHSSSSSKWHRSGHDNGKHKGWYKKSSKSRTYRRTRTTTRPTTSRRLVGTHYYYSRASAAAGVRFAQSKGYYATSVYSSSLRRWIVRVYTR